MLHIAAVTLAAVIASVDAAAVHTVAPTRSAGELTEETWSAIAPTSDFVQRDPHEGGAPSQRTEFRVAYTDSTLFVRVRAFDTAPGAIVSYLTRRDDQSPSDWIRILIDSYHDRRSAFEFAVNPSGVKQDRYWFDDNNKDDSWDAVWDVKVDRDQSGWSAEFRIPFSQLRFTPSSAVTFGFAVSRTVGRLNETSTWPLLARSANGYVSSFGELGGVSMTASVKKIELVPYIVGNLTRQSPGTNPLASRSKGDGAVGLDVKYALTPGLTFTSTFNPDFGQVEADPAVVNLSAFETFFSERRPFFIEGSGTFQFDSGCWDGPCSLFYSRRVGRAPQGTSVLPGGGDVYADYPNQSVILGAGKLTGRVGKFSIGVLDAVTQEETATVQDGVRRYQQAVEPTTNYTVARVRREFANQSSIGGIVTSTNRRLPSALDFLPAHAHAAGVDFDARFRTRYSVNGYLAASSVRGDAGAIAELQKSSRHYYQRPDATSFTLDPTRTSLNGASGRLTLAKIGGQRVRFNAQAGFKTPGFDLNDAGFLRRADERWTSGWLQIRSDVPNRWFRSRSLNFNGWSAWNSDGNQLVKGGNVNGSALFANNWEAGAGVNVNGLTFDDRETRGGPLMLTEGYTSFWSWFNSDNRRRVSLNFFTGAGANGVGSWFRDHEVSATVRPLVPLTITSGVRLNRAVRQEQWADLVTDTRDHYVFGHLNQTTVALTERLNYTMSPNLSLQLYAEPFASGGQYDTFKELVDGRNPVYADRFAPFAFAANPDFNVKSFRTTNVLRWEYKPGSTLFIVWQQARENDAVPRGFQTGRDLHDIFAVAPRNVFLVKLAYWLNY